MESSSKISSLSLINNKTVPTLPSVESMKPLNLSKINSDSALINPNLCLTRKDFLAEDKKRNFNRILNMKSQRDISHIFDSTKYNKKSFLPLNLLEMKKLLIENRTRNPTSAKEIESLESWLNDMKKNYLPDLDLILVGQVIPDKEYVDKVETIYFLAMNEILRQVSVQCKTRAELLKDVIQTIGSVWKCYPKYLEGLLSKEKEETLIDFEALELANQAKLFKYNEQISTLNEKLIEINAEKNELESKIFELQGIISTLNEENELLIKLNQDKEILNIDSATQTDILPIQPLKNPSSSDLNISLSSDSSDSSSKTESKRSSRLSKCSKFSKNNEKNPNNKEFFISILSKICENLNYPGLTFAEFSQKYSEEVKNYEDWLSGFTIGIKMTHNEPKPILASSLSSNRAEKFSPRIPTRPKLTHSKTKYPILRKNTTNTLDESSLISKHSGVASTIISSISSQPLLKIMKKTNSSGKKVLSHVFNYLNSAIFKKYSKHQNFPEFIFSRFVEKYSLKNVAEKKFKDFVYGCVTHYNENPKISLFARALQVGQKVELSNLSEEGCEMLLKVLEWLTCSRTGVVMDSSKILNNQFLPYTRVAECIKIKLEPLLPKLDYSLMLDQLNRINIPDRTNINKQGVVNLDEFLSMFLESYEKYVHKIKAGSNLCINIITEYNYLTKGEVVVLLRHIYPHKYSQFIKSLPFDSRSELENQELIDYCISSGILSSSIVSEFFAVYSKNSKEILENLRQHLDIYLNIIKSTNELTLSLEQWEGKFEEIKEKLKGLDPSKSLQLWHILKKELDYLAAVNNAS